jgi:hypothetical protein
MVTGSAMAEMDGRLAQCMSELVRRDGKLTGLA